MNHSRPNPTVKDFLSTTSNKEKISVLLEYAVLSPSPYNTQPWHFLVSGDKVEIHPNFSRRLHFGDKDLNGLYFTLGAVWENLNTTIRSYGLISESRVVKDGKSFFIEVKIGGFENTVESKIDFASLEAIKTRHTNRAAFLNLSIPEQLRRFINECNTDSVQAFLLDNEQLTARIREMTSSAVKQTFSHKGFTRELSSWLKSSTNKHKLGMPGYVLGIPKWFSFFLPKLIRYGSNSVVVKTQQQVHARWLDSSFTMVLLSVKNLLLEEVIESGRVFESICIEAQKYGVGVGPMSVLVETDGYPEKLKQLTKSEFYPTMLFRIGYITKVHKQSPRLPMSEVVTYK